MELNEIWKKVAIEPELREFIVLSGPDINHLTELAACAPDPVAWLTKELNDRGRAKKNLAEARKIERMAEDKKRIEAVGQWPGSHLNLKTQPWLNTDGKSMRFALVHCGDILTVIERGVAPVTFPSMEELVKIWSVD